ncbi:MAG: UDP-2,3-diacylglucosamine diphosphatase [Rhodocyclales bacterium]|nr:UDP-2,3-diacylglucosamine diphosphatase [Rhodocyclales bacterium]
MILFVSDLHLSAQTPELNALFLQFLGGRARAAEALYILGDLFEYWVGDDDLDTPADPTHAAVVSALRRLADAGVAVNVMRGNRDFLLGDGFAAASGARLLPDPYVLSLPAWQFVLSHGDALCTDDRDYQAFRAQSRSPEWQAAFLAKPLAERHAIARALRERSEAGKAQKAGGADYLMDVNAGATEDFLRTHGYATFIHGHTHKPAMHDHIVDGIHVERWVLADWHGAAGECLVWDGERLVRERLT